MRNRFDALSLDEDTSTWNNFRDALVETANTLKKQKQMDDRRDITFDERKANNK